MTKKIFLSGTFLLVRLLALCQEEVKPIDVRLVYNSVNKATISISFTLDMGSNQVNSDYWVTTKLARPAIKIMNGDREVEGCELTPTAFVTKHGFGVQVTGFSQENTGPLSCKGQG